MNRLGFQRGAVITLVGVSCCFLGYLGWPSIADGDSTIKTFYAASADNTAERTPGDFPCARFFDACLPTRLQQVLGALALLTLKDQGASLLPTALALTVPLPQPVLDLIAAKSEYSTFRFTQLNLSDPHVYYDILGFCKDITDAVSYVFTQSLNSDSQPRDGSYDLGFVYGYKRAPSGEATTTALFAVADCATKGKTCKAVGEILLAEADIHEEGDAPCFDPADHQDALNYESVPSKIDGPCAVTESIKSFNLDVAGIRIPLKNARLATRYESVSNASGVSGVLWGFVSEKDAKATILPETPLPIVTLESRSLYSVLAAGGAEGSSCEAGVDDRDKSGTTRGFWFYLDFTAERVGWNAGSN